MSGDVYTERRYDMPEALRFIEDAVAGMDSRIQAMLDFSRR